MRCRTPKRWLRNDLLADVRARGVRVTARMLEHALASGQIVEPDRNLSGFREYTQTHFDQLLAYARKRVEREKQQAANRQKAKAAK